MINILLSKGIVGLGVSLRPALCTQDDSAACGQMHTRLSSEVSFVTTLAAFSSIMHEQRPDYIYFSLFKVIV